MSLKAEATFKANKIYETVKPILNGLHYQEGISVNDINATVMGMVMRSMETDIGVEQARDFLESVMEKVWKRPKKSIWQRMGIFNLVKAR